MINLKMTNLLGPCARLQCLHLYARRYCSDLRKIHNTCPAPSGAWQHTRFPERRHFTSCFTVRAHQPPPVKRGVAPSKSKSKTPVTSVLSDYLPPRLASARTLAARKTPTHLFQASSSNVYPIACYAISGFSILYGVWNFYDAVLTPSGVWRPLLVFMGLTCGLMIGLGLYIGRNATRLVRSLRVFSTHGPGKGPDSKVLMLQIERKRLIPFGNAKVVIVNAEDAIITSKVSDAIQESETAYKTEPTIEAGKKRVERLQREAEADGSKIGAGKAGTSSAGSFLSNFRRLVTREGMVDLRLRGNLWFYSRKWLVDSRKMVGPKIGKKVFWLDPKDAWFLERGLPLEKLLKER